MNFDGEEILVHMSMSDDEEAGHGEQSMNCRVQCCCMVSVSDCLSTMLRHWSLYLSLATLKYSWTWITDRIRTTDHREADEKQIEFTGLNTCMELLKNQSAPMLRFLDLLQQSIETFASVRLYSLQLWRPPWHQYYHISQSFKIRTKKLHSLFKAQIISFRTLLGLRTISVVHRSCGWNKIGMTHNEVILS